MRPRSDKATKRADGRPAVQRTQSASAGLADGPLTPATVTVLQRMAADTNVPGYTAGAATAPGHAHQSAVSEAGADHGQATPSNSPSVVDAIRSRRPVSAPTAERLRTLQQSIGNPGVGRLLGAGLLPVQRVSATQAKKDIDGDVKRLWPLEYGGGRQGRGADQVRKRYARSMADDRTSQTLSHQSFLVYDAIAGEKEKRKRSNELEREVQGMLINNRLLFASNYNESMDMLESYITDGDEDTYPELVSTHQSDDGRYRGGGQEYLDRMGRADRKTQAVLAGQRGDPDDATVKALRTRFGKPVAMVSTSSPDLHALLTDDAFEGSIFFVRQAGDDDLVHAEQKLLSILHQSAINPKEVRGRHAIMGRYRGCLCCTAALMYYKSKKFGSLDFDPNPGFYYRESLDNLAKHHKHVVTDPDFRAIMQQLASELPSTPAGSNAVVPGDAYENNGPERKVPGGEAATRNYRTPSPSDVEADYDTLGNLSFKPYNRTSTVDEDKQKTRRIGVGSSGTTHRNRVDWVIQDDGDIQEIQEAWLHGSSSEKEEVFKRWYRSEDPRKRAGRTELCSIIRQVDSARSEEAIKAAISRYADGRTGHKESDRKRKETGASLKRVPERGKYAKKNPEKSKAKSDRASQVKMNAKSSGWSTLYGELVKHESFYAEWYRLDREKGGKGKGKKEEIQPRLMPAELLDVVTDLRDEYFVSTMADLLHVNQKSLRTAVTKNLDRRTQASAPAAASPSPVEQAYYYAEDTVMGGMEYEEHGPTAPQGAASYYSGGEEEDFYSDGESQDAGQSAYPYEMGQSSGYIPDVGPSTMRQEEDHFPGYTRQVDRIGQVTYVDNETGALCMWDANAGSMTVISFPQQYNMY